MSFNIVEEMVLIRWKKKVTFVVNGLNVMFSFEVLDMSAAGLVVTVDNFIADGPHFVPFIPYTRHKLSRPELSCLLFSVDALFVQVIILEIGPLLADSAIE